MKKLRFRSIGIALVALLGLAACGGSSDGDDTPVFQSGILYFSQDGNSTGLFMVDTATGAATMVGAGNTGVTAATVGLTGNGTQTELLGTTFSNVHLIQADGSGSAQVSTESGEGAAYCTSNGLLYLCINSSFSSVNVGTGAVTPLAAAPADLEGLACDAARGRIYGIGNTNDLHYYDIAMDTWNLVGDTGMNWDSAGLAYDPVTGVLYAIGDGGGDNLYRLDPTTAAATLIGPMGLGVTANGGLGMTAPVQVSP